MNNKYPNAPYTIHGIGEVARFIETEFPTREAAIEQATKLLRSFEIRRGKYNIVYGEY